MYTNGDWAECGNRLFPTPLLEKCLNNTDAPYAFARAKDLVMGDEFVLNHGGWAFVMCGWQPLRIPNGIGTDCYRTLESDELGTHGCIHASWGDFSNPYDPKGNAGKVQMCENAPVLIKNRKT